MWLAGMPNTKWWVGTGLLPPSKVRGRILIHFFKKDLLEGECRSRGGAVAQAKAEAEGEADPG